jgi:N-acetylmuramoyl-L-alanine amidase
MANTFFCWTAASHSRHYRAMSVALFLTAVISPAASLQAAGVSAIAVEDRQITVRFDDVVEQASSFMLTGPDRIALDVGGVDPGAPIEPSGIIAQVRQARNPNGMTRIVFDLAAPAVVRSGTFSADGRSLVLGIDPVEPADFLSAVSGSRKTYLPPAAHRAAPPRSSYSVTIPLGAPTKGLPRPRIYGAPSRPLVVIDAGHGGHDPGAISPATGKREKDIALAIAQKVRDQLIASGRVRVALTREDDRFLVLRERSAIARSIKADLFISIHADSAPANSATGATIYTLSETASDREAQLLATRENKADIINGINLGGENREIASILVDLAQRETMNSSAGFATLLKREATGLVPFRSDYHRMADLAVLKSPDMSSILFEAGYLTNDTDVARIASADGQSRIAAGIRKAVEIFFARRLASR